MLYPESIPSPQLSAQAAERYAQLQAVAQLRVERKRQRQERIQAAPVLRTS